MKTCGLLLVVVGVWLCLTVILFWPGLFVVGLGAVCWYVGRSVPASRLIRAVNGGLLALLVLSVAYGAMFWGYAVSLQMRALKSPPDASQGHGQQTSQGRSGGSANTAKVSRVQ